MLKKLLTFSNAIQLVCAESAVESQTANQPSMWSFMVLAAQEIF